MNDKKMYAVKCPSPPFLLLIGRECPSVLGLLSFETCIIQAEHRINDWTSPRAFGYIVGLDLLGAVAWWESNHLNKILHQNWQSERKSCSDWKCGQFFCCTKLYHEDKFWIAAHTPQSHPRGCVAQSVQKADKPNNAHMRSYCWTWEKERKHNLKL